MSPSEAAVLPEPAVLEVFGLNAQARRDVFRHTVEPFVLFGRESSAGLSLARSPLRIPPLDLLGIWNERKVRSQGMANQRDEISEHLAASLFGGLLGGNVAL